MSEKDLTATASEIVGRELSEFDPESGAAHFGMSEFFRVNLKSEDYEKISYEEWCDLVGETPDYGDGMDYDYDPDYSPEYSGW